MSVPEADERILPHFAISEQGLRELEIWLGQETLQWGPWVYVGTSQIPFQNGWGNVGGDLQPLRFRLEVPAAKSVQSLQIEGEITGGTAGTVVCSLPRRYRPKKDGYAIGKYGTEAALSVAVWKFQTNGDLIFVGTAGGAGSDTTAIHWGANTDPTGSGVTLSDLGSLILTLLAFNDFEVQNHSGDPLVQFFENGTLLANLPASGRFTFFNQDGDPAWRVFGNGALDGMLKTGKSFTLFNSTGGTAILTITEDSSFEFDLQSGSTFRIYDPAGSGGQARLNIEESGDTTMALDAGKNFTLLDNSGNPILQITEGGNAILSMSSGGITLEADTASIALFSGGTQIVTQSAAGGGSVIDAYLEATGVFTLHDSSGNPMLQMTEGSPDLHLPTGGNVIFDL